MRRILFDQNTPAGLKHYLPRDISTAYQMGWSTLENGKLLAAAQKEGFEVVVACDQSIRHQQNLHSFNIALVILTTTICRCFSSMPATLPKRLTALLRVPAR